MPCKGMAFFFLEPCKVPSREKLARVIFPCREYKKPGKALTHQLPQLPFSSPYVVFFQSSPTWHLFRWTMQKHWRNPQEQLRLQICSMLTSYQQIQKELLFLNKRKPGATQVLSPGPAALLPELWSCQQSPAVPQQKQMRMRLWRLWWMSRG